MPGTSYQDKRRFMFASTVDTLTEIAFRSGLLDGDCGGQDVRVAQRLRPRLRPHWRHAGGLRWSIASDEADMGRVKQTVREMLLAFVELKQPSTSYVGVKSI